MPLSLEEPTFDRSFEELFRELRARIPRYTREWTNFNESDPGITLLQLFAWLAEMTLHKMGDVPRKNYLKFAELLGLQLAPARPARVTLTFSAKPAEAPSPIPARSRYAAQVDGASVVFETDEALSVIAAPLSALLVFAGSMPVKLDPEAVSKDPIYPFGRSPEIGDALYLGFKPNPNNPQPFPQKMRFLALRPEADTMGKPQRVGEQNQSLISPVDLVWEYRPKRHQAGWERLNVFEDGSVAFTRDGYVDVEGPNAIEPAVLPELQPLVKDELFWLRVRVDDGSYPAGRAPRLERFVPNAVDATNLETESETLLGVSDGRAGQSFDFPERPIEPDSLVLRVRAEGVSSDWKRVDDFFDSTPRGEHFVLDANAGRITFGDGREGEIPAAGAEIVARTWRHGGGSAGNRVGPGAIKTMISQVAGIEKVTNLRAAAGGSEEQAIEDFIRHAPRHLRSRDRAVTEHDYEALAESIDGVKKARALGGRHPDYPDVEVAGAITVLLVADSDARPPLPSAELIRGVCAAFESKRLITTEVYVAAPTFFEIRVEARLFADARASFDEVSIQARRRLDEFLNPFARKFGENVSPAAIYSQLFGISSPDNPVRSIEELFLYVNDQLHEPGRPIEVPADALVYSGQHLVVVRPDSDRGSAS